VCQFQGSGVPVSRFRCASFKVPRCVSLGFRCASFKVPVWQFGVPLCQFGVPVCQFQGSGRRQSGAASFWRCLLWQSPFSPWLCCVIHIPRRCDKYYSSCPPGPSFFLMNPPSCRSFVGFVVFALLRRHSSRSFYS